MLHHLRDLKGFEVVGSDDSVGAIYDFLFDAQNWSVRYAVVDTGGWLHGRRVLLSPTTIQRVDEAPGRIIFGLRREQIENSPPLQSVDPVSRAYEAELAGYYGWPAYWGGAGAQESAAGGPVFTAPDAGTSQSRSFEAHLRSVNQVTACDLHGLDGRIGKVQDFLCDDEEWRIRYMVVDTGGWLTGRLILVAPAWIDQIDWRDTRVHVQMTREQVESSPEYDPSAPPPREYEERLHEHYGRERYWIADRNAPAVRL